MNTIAAISTPYGAGGIAVVRVSGTDALTIVDSLFRGKRRLQDAKPYSVLYGEIARQVNGQIEVLDEVLVSVFRTPHSFTGEDVAEIACHGSLYIQQELLRWLIEAGCTLAAPGEFTQRAFLNGKMDLSKAEAVADLIASESKAAHDLALQQLKGGISMELAMLRDRLLHFTSLVELELDFADHEELEFADRTEFSALADEISAHIARLLSSFHAGNAIRNGIPVAIIGPTNAGKSTLLNRLVGEERAIVSDEHGTTRDTIEDVVNINGLQFRFIDTAGIRSTDNKIEGLGISRSIEAARKASIILFVSDARNPQPLFAELGNLQDKTVITILNKVDLLEHTPDTHAIPASPHPTMQTGTLSIPTQEESSSPLYLSAKTAESTVVENKVNADDKLYLSAKNGDLTALRTRLLQAVPDMQGVQQGIVISNIRHFEALQRAFDAITRVQSGLRSSLSGEFLSMDLQDCLQSLGEITGSITSQDILNNIFSKFCIGK